MSIEQKALPSSIPDALPTYTNYQLDRGIKLGKTLHTLQSMQSVFQASGRETFQVQWKDVENQEQVTVIDRKFLSGTFNIAYGIKKDMILDGEKACADEIWNRFLGQPKQP